MLKNENSSSRDGGKGFRLYPVLTTIAAISTPLYWITTRVCACTIIVLNFLVLPATPVSLAKRSSTAPTPFISVGLTFGARHNASNSLSDIAGLVPFAHRYGAKIFVTLNTILHDDELEPAQRLITDLYEAGVDALIVQDMGIMELDLPPIELHASTPV
ncbi:peptidase U32 [Klebsiella variicola]|uniref:Peptidase U32 n=1 Tax=Klebsiella variicola TaxID=244366 RepID=A0A7H4ML69_KLEVA|nr:peptidase U32 [Klebsiella variicola]